MLELAIAFKSLSLLRNSEIGETRISEKLRFLSNNLLSNSYQSLNRFNLKVNSVWRIYIYDIILQLIIMFVAIGSYKTKSEAILNSF